MNKKIASEIAVGTVLIIAIIIGGIFWWQNETDNKLSNLDNNEQKTGNIQQMNKTESEINIPNGWKLYKQDVLGIEFIYPEYWGDPATEPTYAITNLKKLPNVEDDENNTYFDSILIRFTSSEFPDIRIFGDKYRGEFYPNSEAYKYGYIDNIGQLKNSGSICDYRINFNTEYEETLEEIQNSCSGGVKEALLRNKEVFAKEVGILYSFDYKLFGYARLQNGLFDNVLASLYLDGVTQTKQSTVTLDELIERGETKSPKETERSIDRDTFDKWKNDFRIFVASIKSYKPVIKKAGEFQNILGEDANIAAIRKYYWLLYSGKLQEAYNMYLTQKPVSFETFKKWYEDLYFIEPYDFKKTSEGQYEFMVRYQDNNNPETKYRIIMNVSGGKVETKSSTEILTDISTFKYLKAYAIRRGDKNYVILDNNGTEKIIDQGDATEHERNGETINLSELRSFGEINFSPGGNYITYRASGYEWLSGYIYDIKNGKVIFEQDAADGLVFSEDEKHLVSCAASIFSGAFEGQVYSTSDLKKAIFDIKKFDQNLEKNFALGEIKCKIEGDIVSFNLDNDSWEGEDKDQYPANEIIKYSLSQNKVIK